MDRQVLYAAWYYTAAALTDYEPRFKIDVPSFVLSPFYPICG